MARLKGDKACGIEHQAAVDELEIGRAAKAAEIESKKFKSIVDAIGPATIVSIARAGPELQAQLRERSVPASISTIWRFFARHRMTFKKRRRMLPSKSGLM